VVFFIFPAGKLSAHSMMRVKPMEKIFMPTILLIVAIGMLGGFAVGIQGPLASLISQRVGVLESTFIVHLGGAIAALIPLLVLGGGHLGQWRNAPWYALGAGALGLVLIAAVSYMLPRVGASTAIILIVAGQIIVSVILDHVGAFGLEVRRIDPSRLVGMGVVFIGIWLTVRK
jgi:bacterial/archaeal transporter family-2 protein